MSSTSGTRNEVISPVMVFDDFNCVFFLSRIFYRHPHWHKSVDSTITSKNTENKEKCSGRPFNILKRSLRNGTYHGHLWDWLSKKNCMLMKMYFDFYSFSGRKRVERFRSEVIKVGNNLFYLRGEFAEVARGRTCSGENPLDTPSTRWS